MITYAPSGTSAHHRGKEPKNEGMTKSAIVARVALALVALELPHGRLRPAARANGVSWVVEPLSLCLLDGLAVPTDRLHRDSAEGMRRSVGHTNVLA